MTDAIIQRPDETTEASFEDLATTLAGGSDPHAEERVASELEAALASHLVGGRVSADAGHTGVAAVSLWIFWDVVPHGLAIAWATLFLVGVAARMAFRKYAIRPETPPSQVLSIVRGDVWIAAAIWGAWAFLVMGAPPTELAFLLVIFAGLVAAATSTLVADAPSFYGFMVLLLGSLALSVGLTGMGRDHAALLMLLLIFAPFMVVAYRRAYGVLTDQLRSAARLRISEEETSRSRDFLNALVSSAPSPIVVLDDIGLVLQANPAFHHATGRDDADLTGEPFVELVTRSGKERRSLRSYLDTVRDGARSVAELPLTRVDGSEVWMRLSGTRARGQARGTVILVAEDVTDQVAAREAQEQARHQAEQAARAKSSFLASMSHEIRTPMNGILGMIELLLDSSLTDSQREAGEVIRSSGEGLLRILNDILDVSKIEAGQLDLEEIEFDPHQLVVETARILSARAAQAGNELLVDVGDEVPKRAMGDPVRIRQVLTNLLSNAVKFTKNGEVIIAATHVGTTSEGVQVHFSVKDTGVGIPEEKQELIFQEFEQADTSTTRTHGGTGLGLTISRRLVALMGGTLELESVVGRGSDFRFVLELGEPSQESDGSQRPPVTGEAIRGRRFLVVDDNATARRIVREALKHMGADEVVVASDVDSGLAVLRSAQKDGAPFDAVVLDHMMPRRDGFDFAEEVLGDPAISHTPMLMATSAGLGDAKSRAREMGLHGFLSKPVTRADLVRALSALLAQDEYEGPERRLVTQETIIRTPNTVWILLAEDNAVNQQVAIALLKKRGYEVDAVVDGQQAVDAVQERSYDIVLMDIQMPIMDGLEATRQIRSLPGFADLPIVALTAHAFAEERERCNQAGMNDFLAKPFKPDDLYELVERWTTDRDEPGTGSGKDAPMDENAGTPPVDIESFRAVMREAGIEEIVDTTLEIYQSEAPGIFAALEQAMEAGDAEGIRAQAHGLKSSSGNIRAGGLAELLQQLESLGREGDIAGAKDFFPGVAKEYRSVMDYLAEQGS